jgi:hypothetical protein
MTPPSHSSFFSGRIPHKRGLYLDFATLTLSCVMPLLSDPCDWMNPFLHKFIELLMVICRELEKVMEVMARNCCMLQIQEATSRSLLWVSFWTEYCLLMTQLCGFQITKEVGIFTFVLYWSCYLFYYSSSFEKMHFGQIRAAYLHDQIYPGYPLF